MACMVNGTATCEQISEQLVVQNRLAVCDEASLSQRHAFVVSSVFHIQSAPLLLISCQDAAATVNQYIPQ